MSYLELLIKGGLYFQEYVAKGIPYPVFYGDLVNKLSRVKKSSEFHFVVLENNETPSTSSI